MEAESRATANFTTGQATSSSAAASPSKSSNHSCYLCSRWTVIKLWCSLPVTLFAASLSLTRFIVFFTVFVLSWCIVLRGSSNPSLCLGNVGPSTKKKFNLVHLLLQCIAMSLDKVLHWPIRYVQYMPAFMVDPFVTWTALFPLFTWQMWQQWIKCCCDTLPETVKFLPHEQLCREGFGVW